MTYKLLLFLLASIKISTEVAFCLKLEAYKARHNFGKYMKSNILWPAVPQRPFVTVWNIDTSACKKKYNVSIDLSYFDIVVNPNQTRSGVNIVIFYAPLLGFYPRFDEDKKPINGGIPQLGNITAHFEKCVKDVEKSMPDKNFEGLAVIDWEAWRPLWPWNGWGNGKIYQQASIDKVRKEHPDWPAKNITEKAATEFEEAAKSYMLGTVELVRLIRPKAKWGYYLYPDCYNYDKTGADLSCHNDTLVRNDKIQWLFDISTALYPSTYLGLWFKNKATANEYTMNRINEAKRVDYDRPGNMSIPIYVYNNLVYRNTRDFLSIHDLDATSGMAAVLGASGVVLWADYMDNSKNICLELSHYVSTDLGPYIKWLSESAIDCSLKLCNGHGRCVVTASENPSHQSLPYSMKLFVAFLVPSGTMYKIKCQCYSGFDGDTCDHQIDSNES